MGDVSTQDILQMQENITGAIRHEVGQVRTEVGQVRTELKEGLSELRAEQTEDRRRVEALTVHVSKLEERTKLTSRGLLSALTSKQKAALWTGALGAGGMVLDGLRHLYAAALAAIKAGVHP